MRGSHQRLRDVKKAMASVCKVTSLAVVRLQTESEFQVVTYFFFCLRHQACQEVRAGQRSKCTRHGVPRKKTTKNPPEYLKSRVQVGDLNVKENNVGIVLTRIISISIYIHSTLTSGVFCAYAFIFKSWSQSYDIEGERHSRDRHLITTRQQGSSSNHLSRHRWLQTQAAFPPVNGS